MTREQQQHVKSLRRRHDRLSERLANWQGSDAGADATRRERAALGWVIKMIETADRTGDLSFIETAVNVVVPDEAS